ncbi:MAG: NlpC/P60 family protein [Pseudomonadota bacterium]
MIDRRFHHANARVAHDALSGQVDPSLTLSTGALRRLCVPLSDLVAKPQGARDKQLVFGQPFFVLEDHDGWAFGFDPVDEYTGYLPSSDLHEGPDPTHRVMARSTHVYSAPDIKSPETMALSFFSELVVAEEHADFVALITGGYVPRQHVQPLSWRADDPVLVAESLLGTPYLWGGNSCFGIDCSGLVQLAFWAAGLACPRDSDLQATQFDATTPPLRRGDLVFWKGHVGMMCDPEHLLHANAHHMSVAIEPFKTARTRIAAKEFGDITGFARP